LAIISCPGCGRDGLRIPDGRRGKVTCPTCGAEWFHPESVEINEVEFRCAHSGARFIVQLARRSPLHKFVIHGIKDAPAPTRSSGEVGSTSAEDDSEKAIIPNQRSDAPRPSRPAVLLSRLFGKAVQAASPAKLSENGVNKSDSKAKLYPARHDASEYNWSSFVRIAMLLALFIVMEDISPAMAQSKSEAGAAFINAFAGARDSSRVQLSHLRSRRQL
jgi:hypothetical protein